MMNKRTLLLVALIVSTSLTGCIKRYMQPIFEEIQPNETAFQVPLDNAENTGVTQPQAEQSATGPKVAVADKKGQSQSRFMSVEYLEANKVPTKRVEILQRWVWTGWMPFAGRWIPKIKLIKVDRTPISREWTAGNTTGTDAKDQRFAAESKESIGFWTEVTCAVQIREEDAAKFLYFYAGKPLADITDHEIRNRLQKTFAAECSRRSVDQIRAGKADIISAMEKDAVPFFAAKGITVANIGWSGEFTYQEAEIQKAINKRFVAAQELAAQDDVNKRMLLEAQAIRELASAGGAQYQLEKRRLELLEQAITRASPDHIFPQVGSSGTILNLGK